MPSDPSSPTINIDIPEPAPAWKTLPEAGAICAASARAALHRVAPGLHRAELAILLADDAAVRALNRRWRGRDNPTNVLSFPAAPVEGAPTLLGDIVLAFETVAAEAGEQRKSLADHVRHLVVHAALHLLGHDHEQEDEATRMERLEVEILAGLGVADPYALAEPGHG